jgi:hypothetical protein
LPRQGQQPYTPSFRLVSSPPSTPPHRPPIHSIEPPNLAEQIRHNGNRSSSPRLLHCALLRSRRRILWPHEIRTQEYLSLPFSFPFPLPFPSYFPPPTVLAQPLPSKPNWQPQYSPGTPTTLSQQRRSTPPPPTSPSPRNPTPRSPPSLSCPTQPKHPSPSSRPRKSRRRYLRKRRS